MIEDDSTASQTYELYGPTEYSMAEIAQLVDKEIIKHRRHLNIPKRLMKPAAALLNRLLWWKTTSADEVEREFIDQVIDPKAKTFKDLGIQPSELSNFTFFYLVSCLFSVNVFKNEKRLTVFSNNSKHIEAGRSTICLLRRSVRKGRRRSIYMSLTINRVFSFEQKKNSKFIPLKFIHDLFSKSS